MKKLIFASLAIAALASCSQESTMDVAITSAQIPIQFSTYSSSATTKGNPVDSNTEFQTTGAQFKVSAYANLTASKTFGKYFNFSTVEYGSSAWENKDDMYYPNEAATILFGAYYPSGADGLSEAEGSTPDFEPTAITAPVLTIPYTVYGDYPSSNSKTVADQDDLMYAVTSFGYSAPTTEESASTSTDPDADMTVNLHFKHALTQVAFTATKDSDLDVVVNSITICNVVNGGTFKAESVTDASNTTDAADGTVGDANVDVDDMGAWTLPDSKTYNHYTAAMAGSASVTVGDEVTSLTNTDDALMLIPQALTAWTYANSGTDAGSDSATATVTGTGSYLAIDCTITHADAEVPIIDGIVYVPFSTSGITYDSATTSFNTTYANAWAPGYKITYNLVFGGGYTDPTPGTTPTIPDPGNEPDPDDLVSTLRAITYTMSIDEWKTTTGNTSITLP